MTKLVIALILVAVILIGGLVKLLRNSRQPMGTPEQLERNFADIAPPLTPDAAVLEANKCLYCYDAPCTIACPTHIDVPGFIKKIASSNLTGSARVIFDANPIGATCASRKRAARCGGTWWRRGPPNSRTRSGWRRTTTSFSAHPAVSTPERHVGVDHPVISRRLRP